MIILTAHFLNRPRGGFFMSNSGQTGQRVRQTRQRVRQTLGQLLKEKQAKANALLLKISCKGKRDVNVSR